MVKPFKERLVIAAKEVESIQMQNDSFADQDEDSPLILDAAKKYDVCPIRLADYFNQNCFTAESFRRQHADDMGVPYSVLCD